MINSSTTFYELTFIERIFHELSADSICFGLISYILSRLNWIRFAYPLVLLSLPAMGAVIFIIVYFLI